MEIQATNPITVPAQDAATYDKWRILGIQINGADFANVTASVTFRLYRDLPDGTQEYHPTQPPVVMVLDYIMQSTDTGIQNAIGAMLTAAVQQAMSRGLI